MRLWVDQPEVGEFRILLLENLFNSLPCRFGRGEDVGVYRLHVHLQFDVGALEADQPVARVLPGEQHGVAPLGGEDLTAVDGAAVVLAEDPAQPVSKLVLADVRMLYPELRSHAALPTETVDAETNPNATTRPCGNGWLTGTAGEHDGGERP